MYKLLRIVSLVLFLGGIVSAPFLGLYTMFFLPFVGMVGYLVSVCLEPPKPTSWKHPRSYMLKMPRKLCSRHGRYSCDVCPEWWTKYSIHEKPE